MKKKETPAEQQHEPAFHEGPDPSAEISTGQEARSVARSAHQSEAELALEDLQNAEAEVARCEQQLVAAKERVRLAAARAQPYRKQASLADCNRQMASTFSNFSTPTHVILGTGPVPPLPGALNEAEKKKGK